jgi:hypothetical protein
MIDAPRLSCDGREAVPRTGSSRHGVFNDSRWQFMHAGLMLLIFAAMAQGTLDDGPARAESRPASVPADVPVPRADANSKIAHEELIQKARYGATCGRIDVYFIGNSITRRWGGSDPQYRDLLESWRESFFGWNAANFGWGGDTTNNILWRLQNGELEGLQPKVFVILAGTNNLGRSSERVDP